MITLGLWTGIALIAGLILLLMGPLILTVFAPKAERPLTRVEKLEDMLRYFYNNHLEDGIDGTSFDNAVVNALLALKSQFTEKGENRG